MGKIGTVAKIVFCVVGIALMLYFVVDVPNLRIYAAIAVFLIAICYFQLWQYTPCDKKRVRQLIREEASRRQRATTDNGSESNASAESVTSPSETEVTPRRRQRARGHEVRRSPSRALFCTPTMEQPAPVFVAATPPLSPISPRYIVSPRSRPYG